MYGLSEKIEAGSCRSIAELDSLQGSKHQTPILHQSPRNQPDPEILEIRAGPGLIRPRNTPEQQFPGHLETEDDRSLWVESDGYMVKMFIYYELLIFNTGAEVKTGLTRTKTGALQCT